MFAHFRLNRFAEPYQCKKETSWLEHSRVGNDCFQADLEVGRVSDEAGEVRDREHLIDRLQNLRAIVPVFAQELASARRKATRLRLDNARLAEQLRQLQHQRIGAEERRTGAPVGTAAEFVNTPLPTPFDGVGTQAAAGLAP